MSVPDTDLLGQPLTELEQEVARVHASLEALARRDDLPPCVAAGARHALAATWQVMNDLDLPCGQPEDV
ncbi:MAG: hypothetical protein VX913_05740 [Planctomycetota bacterium]|nr:hypothetical protein [Planctomycetota bacterium]MEE2712257.1 hypothetical protein [Planctomycetota bacterium]